MVQVWRRIETGEAPRRQGATTEKYREYLREEQHSQRGGPNAAAALGWSGDASPVECSQTFTTGC